MTKIMLVEDDKSLREIYGVRLLAEGYDIVSAGDGEEALAIAIKERPALIVTDVMMPKISGFDMLDILRSTTETKNIRVIMMTALSSEEHRLRGEQMGADRYLVKSQVGIEDVVRVVHEVLGDAPSGVKPSVPGPQPAAPAPPPAPAQPTLPPRPATPAAPAPQVPPAPQPPRPAQPSTMPPVSSTTPAAPSTRQRVIQPISDPSQQVNINDLLDRELAKEAGTTTAALPTAAQERATVQSQLQQLGPAPGQPTPQPPISPIAIDPQGHVSPVAPPPTTPTPPPAQPPQQQPPRTPNPVQPPQRPAAPTPPPAPQA